MNDKISIIVPIYNLENYIKKTVLSICNQTYKNLEIILVDDGSNDNSYSIIKELEKYDERVKIIRQENKGVSKARFKGVEESSGDWVGFVDGDDIIEPQMYEHLLLNAKKFNADISHCGYQMVFPDHIDYYYNTKRIINQDNEKGLIDLLEGKIIEPGLCNKLFKRQLFFEYPFTIDFDFTVKNNEDLLMNYYLFKNSNKSVFEDICPYHYILRKGSAATSEINENKINDPIKVTLKLLEETKDNEKLQKILNLRYIRQLISILTINKESEIIKKSKEFAKLEYNKIITENKNVNIPNKLKIKILFINKFPTLYKLIYYFYKKIRRIDKKYKI